MCGFTGVFSKIEFDNKYKDFLGSKAKEISKDLFHRGPDESGVFLDNKSFMVHQRLSIIDIKHGQQPFFLNKDEFIIYNGEIYNQKYLRKKIKEKGYSFKSNCDTEVLIAGLSIWKEKFIQQIDGMFAFVYINRIKNEIIAARDICGEKPLFYTFDNNNFYFTSELNALKNILEVEISKLNVMRFFKYQYIPAPFTIYDKIFKVLPGEFIKIKNNILKKEKYYKSVNFISNKKNKHNKNKLSHIIKESVKSRLVSDVPVGAFLSGGIDSTLIVKNMREILDKKDFHTFSIGFNEDYYDESAFSEKVSKKYKTSHHHFYFSLNDILENIDIIKKMDEPFGDSSSMAVFFLAKKTAKYVKVVLSGDGADELFGGYYRYRVLRFTKMAKIIPETIRKKMIDLLRGVDNFYFHGIIKLLRISFEKDFYSNVMGNFNENDLNNLLNERTYEDYNILENSVKNAKGNISQKCMECDFNNYLPDDILTKVDRMCMAGSIESRAPFLNKKIIEYAFSLISDYRKGKKILKEILLEDFPKEFVNRKKRGFGIPLDKWFREELGSLLKKRMRCGVLWKKYINEDYVEKILDEHMKNLSDNHYKLWQILVFIIWIEK